MKYTLIAFIICFVGGCSGTCTNIALEKHPHPTLPAPAKRIIAKCGKATNTMDVEMGVPQCMADCFPPPPSENR